MGVSFIGDSQFDALVIKQAGPIAVVFWAGWNNACRAFMPAVEDTAKEYAGRVAFYAVDIDAATAVPTKLGIRSVPTTLLFKSGAVTGQLVGAVPKSKLSSFVSGA